MAIERLRTTIELTRPFLFHNPADDILDSGKKKKTGTAGNDPEEWRKTYLATKSGHLYTKPEVIFGCLREGGKYTKDGRRGTLKAKIAAALQVEDERVEFQGDQYCINGEDPPVNDESVPVFIDKRPVKNPATKGLNMRYRVAVNKCARATFTVAYDDSVLSKNEIEAVLKDSGTLVGIGDGRSIGKGRFKVIETKLLDAG